MEQNLTTLHKRATEPKKYCRCGVRPFNKGRLFHFHEFADLPDPFNNTYYRHWSWSTLLFVREQLWALTQSKYNDV